jgi:hypothetical protein
MTAMAPTAPVSSSLASLATPRNLLIGAGALLVLLLIASE